AVIATARRPAPLEELAERHPGVETAILDLMDADGVAELCDGIGPITGAVLNAGVTRVERFDEGSDATDAAMVETNVVANIRLARGLAPHLEGGRLVFVGSLAGQVPLPYQAVYSGTKAFLHNFGLALRAEWAGRISVGVFEPGGIKTEMTDIEALSRLQSQLADADQVADDLLAFLGSDRALRTPGRVNRLSAAAARLLPDATMARLMERIYRQN
ncbi:MAG: SDR family NAD(P)-dependent oxidoreductase, partial [Litorimonas sp.]